MEKKSTEEYKELATRIGKLILKNKIVLNQYKGHFLSAIINHVKTESLRDMEDCLNLFHKIESHQESNICLKECFHFHCIECYYFFMQDAIYINNQNFLCTHNKKLTPKIRRLFIENFNRLKRFKVTCNICNSTKDKMNFPVSNTHKTCAVCLTCIQTQYIYKKGIKNNCIYCGEVYDDNSENELRYFYEQMLSVDAVRNFYLEDCFECKEKKDSRCFSVVCEDKHKMCKQCVKEKKKNKAENCFCGYQITYL